MPLRILKKDDKSKKDSSKTVSKEEANNMRKDARRDYVRTNRMLSGGQAKLDKNKNNKLDAQDFKILRAEKAKGRGMGLQDEKMKPGKTMAAKKGGMFKGYSKVFETAAKAGQKNTGTSTIVGVKPNPKKSVAKSKRKTFKSMEEMRKAKGFKPGETASEFNKRRAALASAKQAAKATRLGKIVLPIAAAGVAAQQYLKSKMKKKKEMKGDVKGSTAPYKKMGGGMMQKYAEGGPAEQSELARRQRRMGQRKPKPGPLGRAGRGVGKTAGRRAGIPSLPGKAKKNKPMVVIVGDNKKYSTGQGGIERDANNNPYRYSYDADPFLKGKNVVRVSYKSVGGSVTVKTKLGRNKPTKMY